MTERYEAVVVGAGPAGLAAAYELARNGVQTLVLERAKQPGTKAITGGILYGQTNTPYNLDYLLPNFEKEAPVERPIDGYTMHAIAGEKVHEVNLDRLHLHEHKWSYSILRQPFDTWFAQKVHAEARKHGGGVLTDVRVTGPLVENGQIVGVESEELDAIRADVVIAADGATSELVRKSGLRGWMTPERWFQGAKVVLKMPSARIEDAFGVKPGHGHAHLFAGDLFGGVRGGGFLYTNKDTLSIGTVFHLDSLIEGKTEPHRLLDRLLTHPLLANWIGDDYEELEYSAKLVPDGKKAILPEPAKPGLLAVGDAAGQMLAQGPVIKGMNLGITSGILAAQAFLDAKKGGDVRRAAQRYTMSLQSSYVLKDTRPTRYRILGAPLEGRGMEKLLDGLARSGLGRWFIRTGFGRRRLEKMMASPFWAGANPDIRLGYSTLPSLLAETHGKVVERRAKYDTPTLDERIASLGYDTAIGKPHILLLDSAPSASGAATWTCPVSSPQSTRGCYRLEHAKGPDGKERTIVALDTQPCIECGTCGVVAKTEWVHPPGGKGVQYKYG